MAEVGNWIAENSLTVGTGSVVVSGSVSANNARFRDVIPAGIVWYSIRDGDNREAGIGTFDGTNTIARTTIHATFNNLVYENSTPTPLNLTGNAIVSCTLNATAFESFINVLASNVSYDNIASGLAATNVQTAIDEIDVQVGLRETASTGIITGGSGAKVSDTQISVNTGSGEIVDGYTDRKNPTVINVTWSSIPLFTVNMPDNLGAQVIYADNTGTVLQKPNGLTENERRSLIQIAFVSYEDGVITEVQSAGIRSNEVGNTLYDWMYYTDFAARVKGMGINPVTAALSVFADGGTFISPGINTELDITNPNIASYSAVGDINTPTVFDVIFEDGSDYLADQTIIPKFYESAPGVATAITGNDAVIHYFFRIFPNNFVLQLADKTYTNGQTARDSLEVDRNNFDYFLGSQISLPSAQIYVDNSSVDFSNTNVAGIVSLIGTGTGSSGSVAINKLLQLADVLETTYVGNGGKMLSVNVSELGVSFVNGIVFEGEWINGTTYDKYDMATAGSWTGVAMQTTTDSPEPQPSGSPENTIDQSFEFGSASDMSIVRMVHKYTFNTSGIINFLQVRVPFWDVNSITKVTVFNVTNNTINVINNPILAVDQYVILVAGSLGILPGTQFEIWFEYFNSSVATQVQGRWNSVLGTGIPGSQSFTIDNLSVPTVIEIDHTDLDSADRQAELDAGVPGANINIAETADVTRSVSVRIDTVDTASASSTKYTVTLVQNGNRDIRNGRDCTLTSTIPLSEPSEYSVITDHWLGSTNQPSFATVSSELYFDGVLQADVNDAYGIDFEFQPAYISPDWFIISSSGTNAGSGTTGRNELAINNQTGTAYTLALSDSNNYVGMNNAAANVVTIPTNAVTAFPVGTQLVVQRVGTGVTSFSGPGVTIIAVNGLLSLTDRYSMATLIKTAIDTWSLSGDLS